MKRERFGYKDYNRVISPYFVLGTEQYLAFKVAFTTSTNLISPIPGLKIPKVEGSPQILTLNFKLYPDTQNKRALRTKEEKVR